MANNIPKNLTVDSLSWLGASLSIPLSLSDVWPCLHASFEVSRSLPLFYPFYGNWHEIDNYSKGLNTERGHDTSCRYQSFTAHAMNTQVPTYCYCVCKHSTWGLELIWAVTWVQPPISCFLFVLHYNPLLSLLRITKIEYHHCILKGITGVSEPCTLYSICQGSKCNVFCATGLGI